MSIVVSEYSPSIHTTNNITLARSALEKEKKKGINDVRNVGQRLD